MNGCHWVLVVDDEGLMAEVIQDVLKDMNCRVYHAKYGSEALFALSSKVEFRLMITDLQMPGMGGERLIDEVVLQHRNLPIIVLSGSVYDRKKKEELYQKGVAEVLEKPVLITDLEDAVRRILEPVSLPAKAIIKIN